ncbi:cyanase [Nocardioides mangrovicus]|uniref:Cyanate hydratase n=1 Tax=Nocardioides mangrovicus TaxID=2478913 RepID=A0A3L8P451_9ACTN|nr:cyanase [Nocardioides mangrovicus]RLV49208.1 cyanase [Nocardioides mangrovicus]
MSAAAELRERVLTAKQSAGLTWSEIADTLDRPKEWTVSALFGMHPVPKDLAERAGALLDLDPADVALLQRQPYRTAEPELASDPTIYRFHEALAVYGPAIKELIHEEFGDGIMSAINFKLDVSRRPDPGGDRVVVTFDGKFLDYAW